ncbi:30990_t:CDS:1, partial [Gigaspora margarita]
ASKRSRESALFETWDFTKCLAKEASTVNYGFRKLGAKASTFLVFFLAITSLGTGSTFWFATF